MPTINQLPVLNTISSGDQLPVYSPNNGDARRTSIGSLLTFFQQTFASPTLSVNLYVPGSGFNITVPTPVSNDQWMLLQPAGTLATGTITLPLNTGVPDGTSVLITTTQEITSLTIALNGASAIYGAVTSLAAGTATAIRFYQPTNSWYQINAETVYAAGVQNWMATPSSANLRAAMTDETGTGSLVFATSPTLVTPILGTVTSGNISACTSTSMVLVSPILGTPTSGTLTNCTGLPVGTGISGLGTGIATFLATPTSANLNAAVTDDTGTGTLVFSNTPTLITPVIGAATGTSLSLSSFSAVSAAAPTIASATTIAPTTPIAFVSGTTAVVTITAAAPISTGGGTITLIPTGAFTWTTAGNIAVAGTAVVNRALTMTYDATTTKWYPSYV
jgi:hypothetical protein